MLTPFSSSLSEEERISIVGSLRTGTSSGYDNICIWAIKNSINLISKTLTHIVNISLESGIVPDKLKIAKVISLFKSGERKTISKYRPVSILPVFSKILEKAVHCRIINYLDANKILVDNQYGFRRTFQPLLHCLIWSIKFLLLLMTKNIPYVGVFLDLSKAFDTVNHGFYSINLNFMGSVVLP